MKKINISEIIKETLLGILIYILFFPIIIIFSSVVVSSISSNDIF